MAFELQLVIVCANWLPRILSVLLNTLSKAALALCGSRMVVGEFGTGLNWEA